MSIDLIISSAFISAIVACIIRCKQIHQNWVPYAVFDVLCITFVFSMGMLAFIVISKTANCVGIN